MANTFILKRSAVQGKVPTTGDLALGELALNTFDGKLYAKRDNGTVSIVEIGSSVSDGDKGDITVSASGTTWTIDNSAVTYAKIQNVSSTDRILGRSGAGAGVIQEIVCTSAGRALLDDADAATQRTTLGLGTAATSNTGDFATASHTHGNITNAGAIGTTANLPVITTTSGVLTTGSFGTTANTFCQGNDSRLSDTRNTTNSITFNNGGTGGASGSTFNGSAALTVSHNTIGALSSSVTSTQSGYFGDIFLYDDSTPSHYLQITNSANLTAARSLSINVNDANRTISLSGDLTVSSAATVSGTNTGDQTITLTGDITGTGTGSFTTSIATGVIVDADVNTAAAIAGTKISPDFGSQNILTTGNITGNQVTATSDVRKKENIHRIDNPLGIIEALRGVRFDWKESGDTSVGLVAQEVEEVLPEVVVTDSEGTKSVAYGNIVGVLIEAIKEQQTRIEELERLVRS